MYSLHRVLRPVANRSIWGTNPTRWRRVAIVVADGPLRRNSENPGQLIRSYIVVAGEEGETQGDGPAGHQMSEHPRNLSSRTV